MLHGEVKKNPNGQALLVSLSLLDPPFLYKVISVWLSMVQLGSSSGVSIKSRGTRCRGL
jgi:hypothetical protein